jgi:putative ATP-binding cassette transporter
MKVDLVVTLLRRGQIIVANDGMSYRYDKTLDIAKWVRV